MAKQRKKVADYIPTLIYLYLEIIHTTFFTFSWPKQVTWPHILQEVKEVQSYHHLLKINIQNTGAHY